MPTNNPNETPRQRPTMTEKFKERMRREDETVDAINDYCDNPNETPLTVAAPTLVRCFYCGKVIVRGGGRWTHRKTGLAACNPNPRDPSSPQAKPDTEQTK